VNKRWVVESDRMMACLRRHDWWAKRPNKLNEDVRAGAEAYAEREGKTTVYQQHVLRAAADVAEELNNAIYERRHDRRRRSLVLSDFQILMRPLLANLDDGREWRSSEIRVALARHFSLTPRELAERNPSGRNRFTNLVAWALHHLYRACLVERRAPSLYRITPRGRRVLAAHPEQVDVEVCAEFPEWHESRERRATRKRQQRNRAAADRR
jgi:Mrr N-terminal domain